MNKFKNNEMAENMDEFSQPELQHPTLDEVADNHEIAISPEFKKGMEQITDACSKVVDASSCIQTIGEGIGKFLLNEDGTVRDFTNKTVLDATLKQVNDGVSQIVEYAKAMNEALGVNQKSLNDAVSSWPKEIIAHFDKEDRVSLDCLHKDLWWERCIMWLYVIGASVFLCISFGNIIDCERQRDSMKEWLQSNAEAISFGRYAKENMPKAYRIWNQMKAERQTLGEEPVLKEQREFNLEKELKR